jgi:c-di-GMP phosphodiesterase
MSFVHFVKRLFGLAGSTTPPAQPAPKPAPPPTVIKHTPSPAPLARPSIGVMLRREEMLDKQGRLAGYRFSFKGPHGQGGTAPGAYLDALLAANVKSLAERRQAVIALDLAEWPAADFASLVAAHTIFQIDTHAISNLSEISDEARAVMQAIRDSGAGLALRCTDSALSNLTAPALALATHGLVDFASASVEPFERLLKGLRQACPALTLAAENVSLWPEQRLCMALGAEFAMGYFLATVDKQDKTEKLTDCRLVLMELLNLVRSDGDAQALADVAKRDPGVAVHLLAMANAPAYGLRTPITGIDQAIMVLGRETLYRWLAVSVFRAGADSARDEALLEVALARARFMELAALSVGSKQQADELFLVGLLSFVDTLLGLPMKEVMATMSLPTAVRDVLQNNEGPCVPFLMLALAVEKCHEDRATQLAGTLGIELDALSRFRNTAMQWAEEAVS